MTLIVDKINTESRRMDKLDEKYIQVVRKYRKRVETGGGYESMPELWSDFAPLVQQTMHLKYPIQRLLQYTGDFHEFCDAFKDDTDIQEYQEYFDAMDFAWITVLKESDISATDRVRIVNILRDGQDKAQLLGLSQVYIRAADLADDEFNE
ncbi:hypothetical protein BDB01DRAFT_846443 [Pilobolus umbonatus]|nr:hypothetical protein BDB01DRAFT_846443 [Pilobolus umbonatus]